MLSSLVQSVSREGRDYALAATYVQSPFDENLDWKLSATMSPCHVKVCVFGESCLKLSLFVS